MNAKTLTLAIMLLIILGSLGVNAIPDITKNNVKGNANVSLLSNDGFDLEDIFSGIRRAVCIGISDYSGSGNDLNYCDDDARDIEEKLRENGWETKLLTNSGATEENIKGAIENMADVTENKDVTIIQFSGHGTLTALGESALCPYNLWNNEITASELDRWVSDIKGTVILMLDSCFSGGMGLNSEIQNETISEYTQNFTDDFFGGDNNRYVMMACKKYQSSYEIRTLKHGLFSYYVIDSLSEKGDANNDNIVTAEEIFDYVDTKIDENYPDVPQDPRVNDGDPNYDIPVYLPEEDFDTDKEVTLTIKEIKKLDDIDLFPPFDDDGLAEWYYVLNVFSDERVYILDNFANDDSEDNWAPNPYIKQYKFDVNESEITIQIRLMDEDYFSLFGIEFDWDDIADISNETNDDGDPGIFGSQKPGGRVFEYDYNLIDINEKKTIVSRGDDDESGEGEGSSKEDDAEIKITIEDDYEMMTPDLTTLGSITGKEVPKGSEDYHLGSFIVKNSAPLDDWSELKLEWEVDEDSLPYTEDGVTWRFDPEDGENFNSLSPQQEKTVNVYVTVPNKKATLSDGEITIKNSNDPSDVGTVPVSFSLVKSKDISHITNRFERSLGLFEILFNLLQESRLFELIIN